MSLLTNSLQRKISIYSVLTLLVISTISPVTQAKTEDNDLASFNSSEIETIKTIAKEENKDQLTLKLNKEVNKTKNTKLKDYLNNKIVVKTERKIESDKQNFISKYESVNKNYSCWYGTGNEQGFAAAGGTLWKFNLRIRGCADAGRVWSGQIISTWADIYAIGWSYYGETNDRKFEYFTGGYQEWVGSRQGLFKLCISNNYACVQETRPWVEYHATREGFADYWY
jgi:hypothetical protein